MSFENYIFSKMWNIGFYLYLSLFFLFLSLFHKMILAEDFILEYYFDLSSIILIISKILINQLIKLRKYIIMRKFPTFRSKRTRECITECKGNEMRKYLAMAWCFHWSKRESRFFADWLLIHMYTARAHELICSIVTVRCWILNYAELQGRGCFHQILTLQYR